MVVEREGEARNGGRGISLPGHPSGFSRSTSSSPATKPPPAFKQPLSRSLETRLARAPGDIMGFLEACAMGNLQRVEELLERGVVSHSYNQRSQTSIFNKKNFPQ